MITYMVDQLRSWVIEMLLLFVLLVIVGMALMAFATTYLRIVAKFRRPQPVTCPGTRGPALVQVAAFQSAVGRMHGDAVPRLSGCSLWPEHSGCAKDCAAQLAPRH